MRDSNPQPLAPEAIDQNGKSQNVLGKWQSLKNPQPQPRETGRENRENNSVQNRVHFLSKNVQI
jgi:hypothetical protein